MDTKILEDIGYIIEARTPKWNSELFIMFMLVFIGFVVVLFKTKLKFKQKLVSIIFYCYIANVLVVTMLGREGYEISENMRATFIPFFLRDFNETESITKYILEFIFNIFLFIPFGLIIPYLLKEKHKYRNAIVIGVISTIALETTQLVSKLGTFEIDDITANSLGAIVGVLIYYKIRKHKINKRGIENEYTRRNWINISKKI